MKYLLDTNVWIAMLRSKHPEVLAHYKTIDPNTIHTCAVVLGELRTGAMKSAVPAKANSELDSLLRLVTSLPFDDAVVPTYARIRSFLEATGRPIGPLDMQIAAIALANDRTLVTHDIGEFSRVPDLAVEDWQTP